jgi:hypothetical protein
MHLIQITCFSVRLAFRKVLEREELIIAVRGLRGQRVIQRGNHLSLDVLEATVSRPCTTDPREP